MKDVRPTYNGTSEPAGPSSLLEAGQQGIAKPEEIPAGDVRVKQVIASIGVILSFGVKLVHMGLLHWRAYDFVLKRCLDHTEIYSR